MSIVYAFTLLYVFMRVLRYKGDCGSHKPPHIILNQNIFSFLLSLNSCSSSITLFISKKWATLSFCFEFEREVINPSSQVLWSNSSGKRKRGRSLLVKTRHFWTCELWTIRDVDGWTNKKDILRLGEARFASFYVTRHYNEGRISH